MTYNGWKNYETWAVGMYLDGNYTGEGTYRAVLGLAEEVVEGATATDVWTVAEARRFNLADALKEFVEERVRPEEGGLAGDLIGAALSEVEWHDLADHKLAELDEACAPS